MRRESAETSEKEIKLNLIKRQLTSRQIEIMDLVIQEELYIEELPVRLNISIRAVRHHVEAVKKLYGTRNFTLACLKYYKETLQHEAAGIEIKPFKPICSTEDGQ